MRYSLLLLLLTIACSPGENASVQSSSSSITPNLVYKLSSRHTNTCLDYSDVDSQPMTDACQNDSTSQVWKLVPVTSGIYMLQNQGSGKCLHLHENHDDGQPTALDCVPTWWSGHWIINRIGSTPYHQLENRHMAGQCLDSHLSFDDGELREETCSPTYWSQHWTVIPIEECLDTTCNTTRGEDCNVCPDSCGACCGNRQCESQYGEDCESCPDDCGPCQIDIESHGDVCESCPDDCERCLDLCAICPESCDSCTQDDSPTSWSGPTTSFDVIDGRPVIDIDGTTYPPFFLGLNTTAVSSSDPEEAARAWADLEYQIELAKGQGMPIILLNLGWNMQQDADMRAQLLDLLRRHDVFLILRVSATSLMGRMLAYGDWPTPIEDMRLRNLEGDEISEVIQPTCGVPDCHRERPALDETWAQTIHANTATILREIDEQYPERIVGIQLNYLTTGEWFLRWDDRVDQNPGSASEPYYPMYDESSERRFCVYLEQMAPDLSCELPNPSDRNLGTYGSLLLDMSDDRARRSVYFNRFLSEVVVDTISTLAAEAKEMSDDRMLVTTF